MYLNANIGSSVPFGAAVMNTHIFQQSITHQQSNANQAPFYMNPLQQFVPPAWDTISY
jgi:hypothetical protein